jgi:hypothetical protein
MTHMNQTGFLIIDEYLKQVSYHCNNCIGLGIEYDRPKLCQRDRHIFWVF